MSYGFATRAVHGVDYVLHSATKYLGGHNDLLAGALIGPADKLEAVRKLRGIMGGINSPHNIYLLERGLKTFDIEKILQKKI